MSKINLIYNIPTKGVNESEKKEENRKSYRIFGSEFVKNNKDNITLIINGNKSPLIEEYDLKEGNNTIQIIINNPLTNLSRMFEYAESLVNIDELKYLNTQNIKDFSYMFSDCYKL